MDDFGADVFIASDGPRVRRDLPTLFLGSRGATISISSVHFVKVAIIPGTGVEPADPAVILRSHRLYQWSPWQDRGGGMATTGVDGCNTRNATFGSAGRRSRRTDCRPCLGRAGFSPAENVHAWNAFSVLAMTSGNPSSGQCHRPFGSCSLPVTLYC